MDLKKKVFNVLFLCKGNAARSIIAESLLNRNAPGDFRAYSAGSKPTGMLNPRVLDLLKRSDVPVDQLRSKSWDEFTAPDAPQMDFVFTLCDDVAREDCPVWPGGPITAHWSTPAPAQFEGSVTQKAVLLVDIFRTLDTRIGLFISLPFTSLDRISLQRHLDEISAST